MDVISLEENLPMRTNNTLLATAIAATFVVSMNAAYAGLANYPVCSGSDTDIATSACNMPHVDAVTEVGTVAPICDPSQGIMYGTHLFGDSSSSVALPSTTTTGTAYAAAVWRIKGTPKDRMQLTATLQGAEFDFSSSTGARTSTAPTDYPKLVFYSSTAPQPTLLTVNATKTCNATECKWRFGNDGTTTLVDGDKFFIIYRITNANTTLGTEGGEVTMAVKIGTTSQSDIIGAEETITVATGKEPFQISFQSTNNPYIKVAVAAENKGFITQTPSGTPDNELLGPDKAIFGYMYADTTECVKSADGYTDWDFTDIDGDATTLTINEEGQFNASLSDSNGRVYLNTNSGEIEAESVTTTDAVWNLTGTELQNIFLSTSGTTDRGNCANFTSPCVPVIIQADGTNQINVPAEEGPKAQLSVAYVTPTNKQNIKYPSDDAAEQRLAKYIQDGISCWVFNVPFGGAVDEFNMRVINDSSTTPVNLDGTPNTDCVQGTLYGPDSTEIGKESLGCPPAGGTLYIGNNQLKEIYSGYPQTTGRGTMFITSTLQKMEVLAMLRRKAPPCFNPSLPTGQCASNTNPLTNLSTGAHGVACAPNYR
jgi:hypothetical protein